jgi:hypothetical protein
VWVNHLGYSFAAITYLEYDGGGGQTAAAALQGKRRSTIERGAREGREAGR